MGSAVRYYQRIRYRSNHLSLNLTQEKDPGEPLSGLAGFDFNSLHFAVEDAGNLQMLVVGDYSLAFGQGLIMRSEEHTSELQSRGHLVCRLLLVQKKYRYDKVITQHMNQCM